MSHSSKSFFLGFKAFISSLLVLLAITAQASSQEASVSKEERITKIMEIFYIKPKMRTPVDTVNIVGTTARISLWKGLPPDPDPAKLECLGYQILVTGRGKRMGEGAPQIFKEFSDIQKVTLELVDLEFGVKSADQKGKFERVAKKHTYLTMSVSRGALQSYTAKARATKDSLQKSTGECLKVGRSFNIEKEIKL